MTEPTETEDKATLDRFAAALHAIAREVAARPALVKGAPDAGRPHQRDASRPPA